MKLIDLTGMNFGRWTVVSKGYLDSHGHSFWECVCECGKSASVLGSNLRSGSSTSCGCYAKELIGEMNSKNSGERSNTWRGGRHYTVNGYVMVCTGEPGKPSHQKEHRVVMERHLGRDLVKGESVHHINGVRDDNRIENLELWCKPQPTGVRIADAIAWAKDILARYDSHGYYAEEELCL